MTRHIRLLILASLLLSTREIQGQRKFKVTVSETSNWKDSYTLIDENGKTIRQLDTSKYLICFNPDKYVYFGIFALKDYKGWAAIDVNEKVLFNVYNTSFGEPAPDELVENKIRIIAADSLIGFANAQGKIVIKPKFEIATTFHKGKAIIGQYCKNVPWGEHSNESECHHYSIICQKHGYINDKGVVVKIGDFTFEQIAKSINWKAPDE